MEELQLDGQTLISVYQSKVSSLLNDNIMLEARNLVLTRKLTELSNKVSVICYPTTKKNMYTCGKRTASERYFFSSDIWNSVMNSTSIRFPCFENHAFDALAHVGFGFLAISYLMKKVLHLRVCLAFSSVILTGWGVLALPWTACVTTLSWNALFFAINAGYVCHHMRTENDQE